MILRTFPEAYVAICGQRPEHEADPSRLRAAHEAASRSRSVREQGYRIKPWRPGPHTPAAVRRASVYGSYWEFDQELTWGWLDHYYRLMHPDGSHIFVSEPYGLHGDSLSRLARLEDDGWTIDVDAGRSLWFPGATVAVWIQKAT